MSKKMLFIFNPYSGKAQIKNKLLEIIDIFTKGGYLVTAYPTQGYQDAINAVVKHVEEYDLLVCSGGDGTLDEVVTGVIMSKKKIPIGYIPAGSTNDFANSLKIPKNMIKAANIVVSGKKFQCDIGKFNEDIFVYIAAFGLFTDVSYQTKQEVKNVLGHMAYLLEGVKRLYAIQSYHIQVECNDEVIKGEYIYGMISNSISVGGFKKVTGKYVELDDGLFEVLFVRMPKNPLELQEIIVALLNEEMDSKYIFTCKAANIKVTSKKTIPWTLDGEYGGEHKAVLIKNLTHEIEMIVEDK
jgi:lipid kinase, YegS/Rv2252/BmrU family